MNNKLLCMVLLVGSIVLQPAWGEDLIVIVNTANTQPLDKGLLTRIYLGKVSNWPDGTPVMPIDQAEESPIHDRFYLEVLGKSPALVKTLWAQNIFTGRRLPPKIVDPDKEVKRLVSENKNAVGYINASSLDGSVKTVVP